MHITSDFEGGNAKILGVYDDTVILDVELRDTEGDWFFWCFKVCGAEGRTVKFKFEGANRVGYFGAAVSSDMENWHWQYGEAHHDGTSFTYTFAENEGEVFFAHDILYRPKRFYDLVRKKGIPLKTLCLTEKGRPLPYIDTEKGDECIVLTARHHACESTGSYVLEGILDGIIDECSDRFRIICVPFVDLDGVIDGDQGKNRNGRDHNRDYTDDPCYRSVAAICELTGSLNVRFAVDFHSPWHWREENDTLFIPFKHPSVVAGGKRFSRLFESENSADSLPHYASCDLMPDEKWNKVGTAGAANYFITKGAELAFTLETPYFTASGVTFTPERAVNSGKAFLRALRRYLNN